jgi:hypothetical protein
VEADGLLEEIAFVLGEEGVVALHPAADPGDIGGRRQGAGNPDGILTRQEEKKSEHDPSPAIHPAPTTTSIRGGKRDIFRRKKLEGQTADGERHTAGNRQGGSWQTAGTDHLGGSCRAPFGIPARQTADGERHTAGNRQGGSWQTAGTDHLGGSGRAPFGIPDRQTADGERHTAGNRRHGSPQAARTDAPEGFIRDPPGIPYLLKMCYNWRRSKETR